MLRVGRPRLRTGLAVATLLASSGGSLAKAALWPAPASAPDSTATRSLAPTRSAGEIRRLVRAGGEDVLTWCAALLDGPTQAARVLGLEGWRLAPSLPPAVRRQVERTLGDEEPSTRLLALEVLARHDLRPSWPIFAALVDDPSREVRLNAVRALGETGEPKAMLVLMGARRDPDRDVRAAVYTAMGQTGEARAVVFLRPALDDPDERIRRAAAGGLALLGDTSLVTRMEAWAEPSSQGEARTLAGRGLANDAAASTRGRRANASAARDAGTALLALGRIATDEALRFLTTLLREPPHHPALLEGLRRAEARGIPFLRREATHGPPDAAVAALRLLRQEAEARDDLASAACDEAPPSWLEREPAIALGALDLWRSCFARPPTARERHGPGRSFVAELVAREPTLRSPMVRAALLGWLADGVVASGLPRTGDGPTVSGARATALLDDPDAEVRAAVLRLAARTPALQEAVRGTTAWSRALAGSAADERRAAFELVRRAPRAGDVDRLLAHPPLPAGFDAEVTVFDDWVRTLDAIATVDDLGALDRALLSSTSATMRDGLMFVEARLNRARPLDGSRAAVLAKLLGALVSAGAQESTDAADRGSSSARAARALASPRLPPALVPWAAALFAEAAPRTRASLATPLRDAWRRGRLDQAGEAAPGSPPVARRLRLWERDGDHLVPAAYALVPSPCGGQPSQPDEARTDADGVIWCDDLPHATPLPTNGARALDRLSRLDPNASP